LIEIVLYTIVKERGKELVKMTKIIKVTSRNDIEQINRAAVKAPFNVWIHSEDSMFDAKSLLGLFSISPYDTLKVVIPDEADSRKLLHELDRMIEQ
jgi:hypothetical protein